MNTASNKINSSDPILLTQSEFDRFRSLIYDFSGINLEDHKTELLKARLSRRVRSLSLNSFSEYYNYLTKKDSNGIEKLQFINAISTNKTEFFREKAHFDFLEQEGFAFFSRQSLIRILCAGCSTGEEPYTMAMTAYEHFGNKARSKISIDAIDLNTEVLEKARNGVYPVEAAEAMPMERLHRFFLKGTGKSSGFIQVKPELKHMIQFQRHNLMDRLPFSYNFHMIFCRNVIIYFDRATQKKLCQSFHDFLAPRGLLFLGHSESLIYFNLPFHYLRPSLYQR